MRGVRAAGVGIEGGKRGPAGLGHACVLTHTCRIDLTQDLLGETPVPRQLKDQPSFSFLQKKLEMALQAAA